MWLLDHEAQQVERSRMLVRRCRRRTDQGQLYVSVGRAADGHAMIAAEDDCRPLQRAHRDGPGGHVPNREDTYTSTCTTCRWPVVESWASVATCAWQMKRELDLVAAARADQLLEGQTEVQTSDQLVGQQKARYSSPTGCWRAPELSCEQCRLSRSVGWAEVGECGRNTHLWCW